MDQMQQIDVSIQRCSTGGEIPPDVELRNWVVKAIDGRRVPAEITLRIVDEREGAELNKRWRKKSGPTNVLSFAFDSPESMAPMFLGDIVICAPVVAREASEQSKRCRHHWAHMVVHGILHLLGYEHDNERDAEVMEQEERRILHDLGIPDPYHLAS
jgi:probable rRNA maturation factor